MRKLVLLAAALPFVCGASPKMRVGLDQSPPGSKCVESAALDSFVGQPASLELGAQMMAASRARNLRWVGAGKPVSKDRDSKRLTVQLDAQSRVVVARCG
jgi:hypothetical protein